MINGKQQNKTLEDDDKLGRKEYNNKDIYKTYNSGKNDVKYDTYYSNATMMMLMTKMYMTMTTTTRVDFTMINKGSNLDILVSRFDFPQQIE